MDSNDDPVMQELRQVLLDRARAKGSWTLAGNREYWEILDWTAQKTWVYRGGDPLAGGAEDFHDTVDDDKAFNLLLGYCRYHNIEYGQPLPTPAQLLQWVRRTPFI